MTITTFTRVATTTDEQVLDAFDLGYVSAIEYTVEQLYNNDSLVTKVYVTHDGTSTYDTQQGVTTTGAAPTFITTSIVGNSGRLITQPPAIGTRYIITRTTTNSQTYAQSLPAAQYLLDYNNGYVVDFTSEKISVRDETNVQNQFVNASVYVANLALEPVSSKEMLTTTWLSKNDSKILTQNTTVTAISSGQSNNYLYQAVTVTPNHSYRLVVDAQHIFDTPLNVTELSKRALGLSYLNVGTTPGGFEIYTTRVSETPAQYSIPFTTNAESIYVSFGNGLRDSSCEVTSASLKEIAPHHLFSQSNSSFYVEWLESNTVQDLIQINNYDSTKYYKLSIDSSNMVTFTQNSDSEVTTTIGSQSSDNKAVIKINSNTISVILNSNTVNIDKLTVPAITQIAFSDAIKVYSYWPELVNNIP